MHFSTFFKFALIAFAAAPALAMPVMHEDIDARDLSYDEVNVRDLGNFGYTDIDIRDAAGSITARDIASAIFNIPQERTLAGKEIDARNFFLDFLKKLKSGSNNIFGGDLRELQ